MFSPGEGHPEFEPSADRGASHVHAREPRDLLPGAAEEGGATAQHAALQIGSVQVARNSFFNLGTRGTILLLNLFLVPAMLRTFGMELYGVLTVTWMVFGHLGWMDLGFSAACTKYVAESLAVGRSEEAALWAWTSVVAQVVLGVVGAITLWVAAPSLVELLHVGPSQTTLAVLTLRLFALTLPLDLIGRSMAGVLEAAQRFDWVNGLSIFSALATFAVYGAGIIRGGDFLLVVYGLVILKAVSVLGAYWGATCALPPLRSLGVASRLSGSYRHRFRRMIGFGGWMSVNTAVGPLLLNFDRWIISALRGVAFLPFYTVPFSLVTQMSLLPASLAAPLFPAFSAMQARTEWNRAEEYFVRAHRYLLVAVLPMLFTVFVWAPEILRLWVGVDFSTHAATPLRILVLGLSIGLLAPVSGALLQGAGRPELLSRLYLAEFPINAVLMWILVRRYGIAGAAMGYTARTVVETILLWAIVHRTFPWSWREGLGRVLTRVALSALMLAGAAFLLRRAELRNWTSLAGTVVVLVVYALAVFRVLLDQRDRSFLRGAIARRASLGAHV